jgi:hypothetical protein
MGALNAWPHLNRGGIYDFMSAFCLMLLPRVDYRLLANAYILDCSICL